MLGGVLLSSALFLDFGGATSDRLKGILAGAVVIAFVGALDDRFDLPPGAKLAGQIVAAAIPVAAGVEVTNITLPFVGAVNFGDAGGPLTVVGLVGRDERRQPLRRRRTAWPPACARSARSPSRSSPSTSTATTRRSSRRSPPARRSAS